MTCSIFLSFFQSDLSFGFITVSMKSSPESPVVLQDPTLERALCAPVEANLSPSRPASTCSPSRKLRRSPFWAVLLGTWDQTGSTETGHVCPKSCDKGQVRRFGTQGREGKMAGESRKL